MNILIHLLLPIAFHFFIYPKDNNQKKSYGEVCQDIKLQKTSKDSSEIKSYFINSFYTQIFPFWVGTKWDYEGYTNEPKKGVIACGYFVSTPLKHMGVNWNRYKLAQMYASKATDAICDSIQKFSNINDLYKYLLNREDNIYHIGLSFHVGFIVKFQGKIKFLHSDYINASGVKEENILESQALKESSIYYIGRLTNPDFLQKWKKGTKIEFE